MTPADPPSSYADRPGAERIADAARRVADLREAWLNPPNLVIRVPEVVPGYPDRLLPTNEAAAEALKARTLTKLYNERPTWLSNAHRDLDAAVAAAYGWPENISDDDALARLFDLNQQRAGALASAGKSEMPQSSQRSKAASPLQPVAPPLPAAGK